jgi:hypothetical protein
MAGMVSQWWLTYWSNDASYTLHPLIFYILVFAVVGVSASVVAYSRSIVLTFTGVRASRR